MTDALAVQGHLRVIALPSNTVLIGDALERALGFGQARVLRDQKNLIVNTGLSVISRFLGNNANAPTIEGGSTFSSLADITIGSMQLGNAATPPPPTATDTVPVGTLVYSPVLTVSYPTSYSVRFSGVIPITELVGTTITEESLKTVNNLVFAKIVLDTPYVKTNANAVQFDHTITFARA